jgi:DNA mismatch endonuclease (patch repair protein)
MRAVKSENTAPEMVVRCLVHGLGYRFRLHREDLPGKPDLVFPRLRKVVFVHGCFWHGHGCKRGNRIPKTNRKYWQAKIDRNRKRDRESQANLERLGWRTLVVWECETGEADELRKRLEVFLSKDSADASPDLTR